MLKINLVTKGEAEQLAKLRDAHQFYLDNYDREYMRRVRLAKINKAIDLARSLIDFAQAVMNATHNINSLIAANTKTKGGLVVKPIQAVRDQVDDIKRQSEID